MSDILVQYLREARATEAGLIQTLRVHIVATPAGHHRARLEQHLEETRAHEQRLAARIDALGHGGEDPLRQALSLVSGPLGFSLGVARGAARAMLSIVGLPLALFRDEHDTTADRVLRNVRAETASEALEIATYTAIERLAEAEGDSVTAQLAAELREDEERMLEYLNVAVVDLTDAMTGRPPEPEPIPFEDHRGNGGAPTPETRHPTPEIHVSEEPELVAESADVGAEEEAGPEIQVREPWEGYDRMKAGEIERRLHDATDEEAAVVRLYEAAGKNRQTVIRAAERRLRVGG